MIYKHITELIGNTPLLEVPESVHGIPNLKLYAKLELFNPWGSVKDRTAWGMLENHLKELEGGKRVIELSSGNTAKALQMLASLNGSSLKTITNRIKIPEQRDILRLLGAEIEELPGKSDCYDPNDPNDPMVTLQREIQQHPGAYHFTDQYNNQDNLRIHYETTGAEIEADLGKVDYFIAGLGTTGSSRGTAERLKKANPELKVIGVAAEKDDTLPGIRNRDEVLEVGLFDPAYYDEIVYLHSPEAVDYTMILLRQLGIPAGPTSGAAFGGALRYLKQLPPLSSPQTAVFIVCDRIEWYMGYFKERRPDLFGGERKASWREQAEPDAEREIEASEAPGWIEKNQPLIADLRSPLSYKTSRIKGSFNLPWEYLEKMLDEGIPFGKTQPLFLICAVGEKSALAASFLTKNGIPAYSLSGGLTAWRDESLPLERSFNV